MRRRFYFLIFIFCVILFLCKAQNTRIDSLVGVLHKESDDTAKVNTLNGIAYEFRAIAPDSSFYYANTASVLATKLNYTMGMAISFLRMGGAKVNLQKDEEALKYLNEAVRSYEQLLKTNTGSDNIEYVHKIQKGLGSAYHIIGLIYEDWSNYSIAMKNDLTAKKFREDCGDSIGIADSYNAIGLVYQDQGDFLQGLKNLNSSLKMRQAIGDKLGIADSYGNIGAIYDKLGNFSEGLKSFLTCLKVSEDADYKYGISGANNSIGVSYFNQGNYKEALKYFMASLKVDEEIDNKQGLGNTYDNIGIIYDKQGLYSEALENHHKSITIKEETGDKNGIALSYVNIGLTYYDQGNYPDALKNYFTSVKMLEEIGNKQALAAAYINIGQTYLKQRNNHDAALYLNKGLMISKELNIVDYIKEYYCSMASLDSAEGKFKQAFEDHKLFIVYRDSLFNQENTRKLVQSQMNYEFDKKETMVRSEQDKKDALAMKELQRQKLIRNGFEGGFVIVLLFAGVFFAQRNKIKKGKKRSDELLLNILPSETAEELKANGFAKAKGYDEVTVMFTDFKNFTQVSEKLTVDELVHEINFCYSEFDKIISKYGIEKIKTIGDSYMCAGGLPVANKTNAFDTVNAALDIQGFMKQLKEERTKEGKLFFELRIGLNTGPVVAGIVGIKKFSYDIWGDTVNIASRMESSGEVGKVNISNATYELIKDNPMAIGFKCTFRGKVEAKNKGMIDMYFVEREI